MKIVLFLPAKHRFDFFYRYGTSIASIMNEHIAWLNTRKKMKIVKLKGQNLTAFLESISKGIE